MLHLFLWLSRWNNSSCNILSLTSTAVKDGAWTSGVKRMWIYQERTEDLQLSSWAVNGLCYDLHQGAHSTDSTLHDSVGSYWAVMDQWSISLPVNPSERLRQERVAFPSPLSLCLSGSYRLSLFPASSASLPPECCDRRQTAVFSKDVPTKTANFKSERDMSFYPFFLRRPVQFTIQFVIHKIVCNNLTKFNTMCQQIFQIKQQNALFIFQLWLMLTPTLGYLNVNVMVWVWISCFLR